MDLLSRFVMLNHRLSLAIEARLPKAFNQNLNRLCILKVADLLNSRRGQIVLDVGGGKECPFLQDVDEPAAHLIIAFDCSEKELKHNVVDNRVVGDAAMKGLPFRNQSVDLIVSRSVVEHIRDNGTFFENCAQALRPGGTMIHVFPGRFAPFALANRILPNRLSRRLLDYFLPEWVDRDTCGFVAFYDRCHYSAMQDLIRRHGFESARYVFAYYQGIYYTSVFPIYCLMLAYDLILWLFRIRNLASGLLIVAERRIEFRRCQRPVPVKGDLE
jgi:SAM-dependent methyltransferase